MAKDKNEAMSKILAGAKTTTSNKSYAEADKKTDKKESVGKGGRPKTEERHKKKARQVYFSDEEFETEIEKCAEYIGLEPKDYMEMSIRQQVKKTLKIMEG